MDQQPARALKSIYTLLVLILLSPHFSAFASSPLVFPDDHTSTYSIHKYGTTAGNMQNELKRKNGKLIYTSSAETTGFASVLLDESILETSIINFSESENRHHYQQESYTLSRKSNRKKNQKINFNWSASNQLKINGSYKSKKYSLNASTPVWSRQLIPILASGHILASETPNEQVFHITDRGKLRKYIYTLEKKEPLKFKGKEYPTLKYKIGRKGKKRYTYMWLSPAHQYLPLKVEQYKNGSPQASMHLKKLELTNKDASR